MESAADIRAVAEEFIEVNERRKELERREEHLRGLLVQYFDATGTRQLEVGTGKVSYAEAQKVDYDVPLLRQVLPASVFELVSRVSVNDTMLSQLVREGKVDAAAVERARRVTLVHRVVAQAAPVKQATSVTSAEPAEPAKPAKPGQPAKPAEHAMPGKPPKPAKPAKPAVPAKPAKPAEAAKPAKPAGPATQATKASQRTRPAESTQDKRKTRKGRAEIPPE